MTTPATPSGSSKKGDDRNLVALDETTALTTQDRLQVYWERNQRLLVGICIVALLVVIGKLGWDYIGHQRELGVEQEFANANTPEKQKAFIAAHPDHNLAAVAYIQTADEAYTANKPAEALAAYDKALAVLKSGPLAVRAQIGRAVAKAKTGKAAEATNELKQISSDTTLSATARAEASYLLANLAAEARNSADVQKYSDLLNQIAPNSMWAVRAMALRASLPVAAPAAPAPTNAAGATTPAPKSDSSSSSIQVKVPGK